MTSLKRSTTMSIRLVYARIATAPQRLFTTNFMLEMSPTSFKLKNKEERRGSTFTNASEADARKLYDWVQTQGEQAVKDLGFWELMDSLETAGITMKRLSMTDLDWVQ